MCEENLAGRCCGARRLGQGEGGRSPVPGRRWGGGDAGCTRVLEVRGVVGGHVVAVAEAEAFEEADGVACGHGVGAAAALVRGRLPGVAVLAGTVGGAGGGDGGGAEDDLHGAVSRERDGGWGGVGCRLLSCTKGEQPQGGDRPLLLKKILQMAARSLSGSWDIQLSGRGQRVFKCRAAFRILMRSIRYPRKVAWADLAAESCDAG